MRARVASPEAMGPAPVIEIVDHVETVALHLELHEATTADGMRLCLQRKMPDRADRADREAGTGRPPLLLLHGLGQNRHAWSLSRRSFENYLVAKGFEVYTAELRGHGRSRVAGSLLPGSVLELSDGDLPALVDYVLECSGAGQLFLVGHSLGGVLALGAPRVVHERCAGVVAMAAPCIMRAGQPTMHGIGRTLARVMPLVCQASRLLGVFPLQLIGGGMVRLLSLLDDPRVHLPLAHWYPGGIERDLLVELILEGYDREGMGVLRDVLRWLDQGGPAGQGEPRILERAAAFDAPLLLVAADSDRLAPPGSMEGWLGVVASPDRSFLVCGGEGDGAHLGHLDLLLGRHAPRLMWPRVASWLAARSGRVG